MEWKSQHGKLRVVDGVEPGDSENILKKKKKDGGVGGRSKREGIYVHMSDFFLCTAETNTTL